MCADVVMCLAVWVQATATDKYFPLLSDLSGDYVITEKRIKEPKNNKDFIKQGW